jgi:hypothetical protein
MEQTCVFPKKYLAPIVLEPCILWEYRIVVGDLHFVGAPPSERCVVLCEAFRDGGVAPTRGSVLPFVGAPPSGRWVVVCEAFRDEGVAPTQKPARLFALS